jgi:EEF1A lysine methyltransferase 4
MSGWGPSSFDIPCESLLICPQDPPQQVIDDCTKEVDEVLRFGCHHLFGSLKHLIVVWFFRARTCRVLRKGNGMFLYLTFGQPHFRRRFLTRTGTTLEIQQIGDAFHYYLYILRN